MLSSPLSPRPSTTKVEPVRSLFPTSSFLSFTNISIDVADGLLRDGGGSAREALEQAGYDIAPGAASVGSTAKQRWIATSTLMESAAERVRELMKAG